MTLNVDESPDDPIDWQGASGSPVFVDDRLVGVASTCLKGWDGHVLQAVWVGHLWKNQEFCKAAGLDVEGKRYAELRRRIANTLNAVKNRPLRDELGRRLEVADLEGSTLVDHLCGLTQTDLLSLGNLVFRELLQSQVASTLDESLALAKVLDEEVISVLLPWGTQPEIAARLAQSRKTNTGFYLTLPCATMTVAEIYLARLDEREAKIRHELADGRYAVGLLCELFDVRKDWGQDVDSPVRDLLIHIGMAHGVPVTDMTTTDLAVMAKPINDAIKKLANPRFGQAPQRPYLVFHNKTHEESATKLAKLLPEMHVCRVDPNNYAEGEGGLCALLMQFANLKAQREQLQNDRKARHDAMA